MKITFLVTIITIACLLGCHRDLPKREVTNSDEKKFIDFRGDFGKPSLIQYYKNFYDKAFQLKSIEESEYPQEVRIYFEHSFGHTFFRQRFSQNDTMYADLNLGIIEISNDSVYMHHQTQVKTFGSYKYDNLLEIPGQIQDSMILKSESDSSLILDNIAVWFIQIKNGSKVTNILVNGRLEEIKDKAIRDKIFGLISKISYNFSFAFTADQAADSFFTRPYRNFKK